MSKVLRVPKLDLAAVLAQPNPQIDLRLEAFDVSTRNFNKAVSNYTQRAVTEITNRKNGFVAETKKAAEKTAQIETETNQCKLREIELIAALDKEQEEKREGEASVAALRRQLASVKEKVASLDVETEQHRIVAANLMRERKRERAILDAHASSVRRELAWCEDRLKFWIEGIGPDKLLFRWTHVDPADCAREFSFVLDASGRSYKVPTTTPFLPNLPILLDKLNESRDLYAFIRRMRQAFLELAVQGR